MVITCFIIITILANVKLNYGGKYPDFFTYDEIQRLFGGSTNPFPIPKTRKPRTQPPAKKDMLVMEKPEYDNQRPYVEHSFFPYGIPIGKDAKESNGLRRLMKYLWLH